MLCLRLGGVPQLFGMISRALHCLPLLPAVQSHPPVHSLGLVSAHEEGSSESLTNTDTDLFLFRFLK